MVKKVNFNFELAFIFNLIREKGNVRHSEVAYISLIFALPVGKKNFGWRISIDCRYVGPDDNTLPDGWGEMQYEDGSRWITNDTKNTKF